MQQARPSVREYQDSNCVINVFVEQSQNCQLIIGKVSLTPKRQIESQILFISLRGYYIVTKLEQQNKQLRQDSLYSLNSQDHSDNKEKVQSYHNFSILHTLRNQKNNNSAIHQSNKKFIDKEQLRSDSLKLQDSQATCFLQGKQKVSQLEFKDQFQAWQTFTFPFTFNLPSQLPPSLQSINFGGYSIQVRYEIQINNSQKCKQLTLIKTIPLIIRNKKQHKQTQQRYKINLVRFSCYQCLCKCYGNYNFEFQACVLAPGKLRIYVRIFKQGGPVNKIVKSVNVAFYGQMKQVKKILIAEKQINIFDNQFQMMQGEIILDYPGGFKSIQNNLLSIRFWLQPKIQFISSIWAFNKQNTKNDIIL